MQLPHSSGAVDAVKLVTTGGRRFAEIGDSLREVVVASAADVAHWPGLQVHLMCSRCVNVPQYGSIIRVFCVARRVCMPLAPVLPACHRRC